MHPSEDDFRLIPETSRYLKTRTINCLLRGGFFTAEQIMMGSTADFLKINGFGYQSLQEVAEWRDALMAQDPELFNETLASVMQAMDKTESVMTERLARAAMAHIWGKIATGAFTAARVRQMLIDPSQDP
jgi:hypothetical protein